MKKIFITLFVLLISTALYAQSAEMVTKILDSKEATYGEVCYLTAVYKNLVKDNATESSAINALFEEGIVTENISAETPINYEKASFFFANLWDIKNGSLLFKLTNGSPRYAYKQLKVDGILPQNADPHKIPSGTDLLNMYTLGDSKYVAELGAEN